MSDSVKGRNMEPVKRGKVSSSTGEGSTSSLMVGRVSPNDSTWHDSRRLSEAGIRRTSDNSVILTEDTDSFIIGDRVWVGGIKPGQIAFIGETQFAPGEWAGIVLDEPIGKNDGSVSGIRYFQCENKRGVFSRLGRLTRFPLLSQTPSPIQASTPLSKTPPPSMIKSPSSPCAPSLKTPALPTGQTNVTAKDVKVGERVIVMSREGSKAGILRYKGLTGFAAGQWCGVELDDPLGKNDGSVNGVRYFTCEQKYGLFAPVHKVSRSPASGRRPSCQLHHGSLLHYGSKESLNSAASLNTNSSAKKLFPRSFTSPLGFAKSSNQATIKEKEEEIGQLLRERELERSRMTKAAEQADEAEKKLKLLQLHFESFRQETEKKIDTLQNCVRKLEEEKGDILSQLEDVQFRAEEETIIKSDIEVLNNNNLKRINELESLLLEEKSRCENLQQNVNKLEKFENTVVLLKTQLESSKKSEELLKFNYTNAEEQSKNEIKKLYKLKDDLSISLEEKNKDILNLNDEISNISMKLRHKEQEIQNYSANLNMKGEAFENSELKCRHLNEEIAKLGSENELLKSKYIEYQKIYDESLKVNESLKREMESYKENAAGSLAEVNEKYTIAVEKLNNYFEQLTSTEGALKLAKLNKEECERKVLELTKEIEELKVNMNDNISSLEANNEKELGNISNKLNSVENELDFYKNYSSTLLENMKKKIVEVDAFLAAVIERKKENVNTEMLTSLKTKVTNIISEIETQERKVQNSNNGRVVKEDSVPLLTEGISLRDHENDLQIQLELHALEIEELKQKLQKAEGSYNELLQIKDKLENEVSELTSKNNDYSDRLTDLNERLVDNQSQIEQLNVNKAESTKTFESREEVLLAQIHACNREIDDLKQKLQITQEYNSSLNVFKEQLEHGMEELKVKNSDYCNQLSNLNVEVMAKKNQIDELNASKSELIRQFEDKERLLIISREELNQEKEEFVQKVQSSEEKYSKLFALKEKLENDLAEKQRSKEYNTIVSDLNERLNTYQNQIEKLNKCIFDNTKTFEAKEQSLLKEVQDLNEMKLKVQKDYEQQCQFTNDHTNAIEKYKTDIEYLNTQLLKEKERNNEYTALQSILNEKFINFERNCNENIGNYNVKIPVEDKANKLNIKDRMSEINANDEINLLTKENNELKLFNAVSHVMSLQKDVANLKSMIKEVSLRKEFSAEIEKEFNKKLDEICFKLETLVEKPDSKAQFIDENLVQTDQLNANVIKNNLVIKQSVPLAETNENVIKKNIFENEMKFNKLKANVKDFSNAIKDQIIDLENRHKSMRNIKFNYECNFRSMQQLIDEFVELKKELQGVHRTKTRDNHELHSKKELLEGKKCNCVKNGLSSNKVDESSNSYHLANWLEEKELAESQINFLNSIIVDLQNKNTNLLSRINILEKSGEEADKETKTKRKVSQAPRLFCDICDIFDAHETEDCPKQGNEEDSPPPTPKGPENRKQITRPYCEVCEVFGHDTQDCDDGQTF